MGDNAQTAAGVRYPLEAAGPGVEAARFFGARSRLTCATDRRSSKTRRHIPVVNRGSWFLQPSKALSLSSFQQQGGTRFEGDERKGAV